MLFPFILLYITKQFSVASIWVNSLKLANCNSVYVY